VSEKFYLKNTVNQLR